MSTAKSFPLYIYSKKYLRFKNIWGAEIFENIKCEQNYYPHIIFEVFGEQKFSEPCSPNIFSACPYQVFWEQNSTDLETVHNLAVSIGVASICVKLFINRFNFF